MIRPVSRSLAAFSAATLLASAPAAAAVKAAPPVYSPWVAFSALASTPSSQALCGVSSAAAAGAAVQGASGCVFPVTDAPDAAPVAEAAPVAVPAAVTAGGGVGILPLLLGLAALAGAAALLLAGDDDGDTQISISP